MTQNNQHNEMPKDTVEEEEKILFNAWYKDQKEMNPYIMRDYFLNRITTAYNKGVEDESRRCFDTVAENLERHCIYEVGAEALLTPLPEEPFKPSTDETNHISNL